MYIFSKPLSTKSIAVALLNAGTGGTPINMTINFKQVVSSEMPPVINDVSLSLSPTRLVLQRIKP